MGTSVRNPHCGCLRSRWSPLDRSGAVYLSGPREGTEVVLTEVVLGGQGIVGVLRCGALTDGDDHTG